MKDNKDKQTALKITDKAKGNKFIGCKVNGAVEIDKQAKDNEFIDTNINAVRPMRKDCFWGLSSLQWTALGVFIGIIGVIIALVAWRQPIAPSSPAVSNTQTPIERPEVEEKKITSINNAKILPKAVENTPNPLPTKELSHMIEVKKFENAKPRLERPFDQVIFHNYPRDIALTWDDVPNADHYEVEVQWQHVLTKDWHMLPRYPIVTKDTTHNFQFIGAGAGRWRIVAINAEGIRSSYSEWRQFLCEK